MKKDVSGNIVRVKEVPKLTEALLENLNMYRDIKSKGTWVLE